MEPDTKEAVEGAASQAIFTPPALGAPSFFMPLIVERKVKVYPILEPELDSLRVLNTTAGVCLSVASGACGFMLNILWNRMLRPDSPPVEPHINSMEMAGIFVCSALIVAALIGFGLSTWSKHSRIGKLATETNL